MYHIFLLHETNVEEVPSSEYYNARVVKEVNTADSLEFDWSGSGLSFTINSLTTGAMVKDDDGDIIFGGRVISFERDMYGLYHIECEGALAYLNDYIVAPFQINDANGWSRNDRIKALYNYIADAYNHVASTTAWTWNYLQMHPSYCELTDSKNLADVGTEEFMSCLECFKTKLIDNIGATFDVVYEPYDDYFEPRLYIKSTFNLTVDMNSQSIELGQNIVDTKLKRDFSNLITRVVPLGKKLEGKYSATSGRVNIKSVNSGKLHLDDSTAKSQYGTICKTVIFDNITNENTLKTRGESYLSDHCRPQYTIELNAVDLHQIDSSIEKFKVGRKVRVVIPTIGVDEWMTISKYEYNISSPKDSQITIGDEVTRLSTVNLNAYYDMREDRQLATEVATNATDGIMVNVTTAENESISGTTLTGIVNGVEITATETSEVNANNGDYFVKAQNGKLYKINFDDLEDELMVSILSTDFDKLVSGKNVIVDNLLANKIFAENITATGTITGAKLIGSEFSATDGNGRETLINKNAMYIKGQDRFVALQSILDPASIQLKEANTYKLDIMVQEGSSIIESNTDLELSTDSGMYLSFDYLRINGSTFADLFVVDTVTSAVGANIAANGTQTIQADCTKAGYKPLAVVGYQLLGSSNQSSMNTYRVLLTGTTAEVRVRNVHASTAVQGPYVTFFILYVKNI